MLTRFRGDFFWGAATSAFQIEGAPYADGKGPSIWDVFCRIPGKTAAGDTGEIACGHYDRYGEDVTLMSTLGLRAYRFSISWPRVMPAGRGKVNVPGLDFYDRLVDRLCANGIEPFATLYHWDLPAALQIELGGWIHDDLPCIFADYAAAAFDRLGDRVRYWLTINEPWVVVDAGYFHGVHAPGVCDQQLGYRAGHNLLRAHAYAVQRYRDSAHSGGNISLALNAAYSYPDRDTPEDHAAAERAMVAMAGWFGDPLVRGDYPALMRERLGDLLPPMRDEDAALLRGSIDYLALNYYTSNRVRHAPGAGAMELETVAQPGLPTTEMGWPIVPAGLYRLVGWLARRYPNLPVYVTENGAALPDEPDANGFVNDVGRIHYLADHIAALAAAMKDGIDVRGYFVWSLIDNLEWSAGYEKRFGLIRCDRDTLRRTIKASGHWYADLISRGAIAFDALPHLFDPARPMRA